MVIGIVPPYLLTRIARLDEPRFQVAAAAAAHTLEHDTPRSARLTLTIDENNDLVAELHTAPNRTISDAKHLEKLPGATVRTEGADPTGDAAADEAYDGL